MTFTYTRTTGFDQIIIRYSDDLEDADFLILGDVTDSEMSAAFAAEGADFEGFTCRIS